MAMTRADAGTTIVPATRAAILAAAHAAISAHGIRRTTVADIARRSDVSRQTVYRYWPDVTALYGEVLTAELVRSLRPDAEPTSLDAFVRGLVDTAERVRDLPMLQRLRETDPELLSRYVLERLGSSQREILMRLRAQLRAAQRAGIVRSCDARRIAAMVLLIVQSAVLTGPLLSDDLPPRAWRRELTTALRTYLAPAEPPAEPHS